MSDALFIITVTDERASIWAEGDVSANALDLAISVLRDKTPKANPGAKPKTFFDRLQAERKELLGRIEKLDAFIDGPDFAAVPFDQQNLLHAQCAAMFDYSRILGKRIAALTAGTQGYARAVEQIDEGVRMTGGGQSEEPLPFRD